MEQPVGAVKLSDLTRDTKTIQVPYGDEKVQVTYRPGSYTPEDEDAFWSALDDKRGGQALIVSLARTLVEWDLTDDDGAPYPVTAEAMMVLPLRFIQAVYVAIGDDQAPPEPEGSLAG